MPDPEEGAQWAEWRMESASPGFARRGRSRIAVQTALVPPDANAGARFEVEFLEDVLHMFLNSARAAIEDLPDLMVALSSDDPFDDLELALGQVRRLVLGDA